MLPQIAISKDIKFGIKPHWHKGFFENPEQIEYYGHRWFFVFDWFGIEILIDGQ